MLHQLHNCHMHRDCEGSEESTNVYVAPLIA